MLCDHIMKQFQVQGRTLESPTSSLTLCDGPSDLLEMDNRFRAWAASRLKRTMFVVYCVIGNPARIGEVMAIHASVIPDKTK